jgi:tRNA-2-methylthio-N6-dimethylallyladenosine synthase
MARKLYIKTHGCQMNVYDSVQTARLLTDTHGLEITHEPEQADILLLNTCSVREKAQEKVFSQLGQWHEWKKCRPDLVIGVGGCVASQEGHAIRARAPFVDFVFGPQTLQRVPEMLEQSRINRSPVVDVSFTENEKFDSLPDALADGPTASVSVMEGCSKYCTFCVVPYTRGPEFSRPFDSVVAEIAMLASQGVRDVTLLGQNVNAYRDERQSGGAGDLAFLISCIATIDGIDRIRFTTSHPAELSERLIDSYRIVPELAGHLHLPVQSGSDRILQLMKRGYTVAGYLEKVGLLRQARSELSLTTDIIVGFPGETERDFEATLQLVEQVQFDGAFSFIFSPRPGTPAANMHDTTPAEVKRERLATLQERIAALSNTMQQRLLNTVQTVLVEGPAKKNRTQLSGRTESNRVVNFPGNGCQVGQFVQVKITEALANSLRGVVVTNASGSR